MARDLQVFTLANAYTFAMPLTACVGLAVGAKIVQSVCGKKRRLESTTNEEIKRKKVNE